MTSPSVLRRALEWSTSWMRLKRKLPPRFGGNPIYVSPVASLGYLVRPLSRMDPGLLSLVEKHVQPGMSVWDVGANVGLFSFPAAHRAGRKGVVVAIEPDPRMCGLLALSAARQSPGSAPVHLVGLAVSNRIGPVRFDTARRSRAANHLAGLGSSQTGGVRRSNWILAIDLDFLAVHLRPPDVLKIDVEGAELLALEGASSLLKENRPTILCEVSSELSAAVSNFLIDHDYILYDGDGSGEDPVQSAPWSTVAIPVERLGSCA